MYHVRTYGTSLEREDLLARLASAVEQLENDDSWGDKLTDKIADALAQIEEDFTHKGEAGSAIARLEYLYSHGRASQQLERDWSDRLLSLSRDELRSGSWSDLEKALKHAKRGNFQVVAGWLARTERRFLSTIEQYDQLPITEAEVTTETVLAHKYLNSGVEYWLSSLALFEETMGTPDFCEQSILQLAEKGQKHLVAVSLLNREVSNRYRFNGMSRN